MPAAAPPPSCTTISNAPITIMSHLWFFTARISADTWRSDLEKNSATMMWFMSGRFLESAFTYPGSILPVNSPIWLTLMRKICLKTLIDTLHNERTSQGRMNFPPCIRVYIVCLVCAIWLTIEWRHAWILPRGHLKKVDFLHDFGIFNIQYEHFWTQRDFIHRKPTLTKFV